MTSKEILSEWIKAFNDHDVEALTASYHPEAINYQVAAGEPLIGREKIRDDLINFFSAFPDVYADVENLIGDGDWAAWEWLGGGTFKGEFLGVEPTGKSFKLRGCGFFQMKEGLIIYQRGYWDKLTWFSQIGL